MKTTRKRSQFIVRQVTSDADLAACLALEHGYATDHVWQMDVRENGEDDVAIRFRVVRLPRVMHVDYPRDKAELRQSFSQRDCFLVAEADQIILGYINMRIGADGARAWVRDLVVGESFRRRRIASALLDQAMRWAMLRDIRHVTLEMQTKNYPAIQFARGKGFVFCGFNDHYYANRDIAVFFDRHMA